MHCTIPQCGGAIRNFYNHFSPPCIKKIKFIYYSMLRRLKSHTNSSPKWTAILKALADENRLQIIHELLKNELSVRDLSDTLNMKDYNISKHLKVLEATGLVKKKKDGVHRIYHITENFSSRLSNDNQVLDLGCCKFIFK